MQKLGAYLSMYLVMDQFKPCIACVLWRLNILCFLSIYCTVITKLFVNLFHIFQNPTCLLSRLLCDHGTI